MKRKLLGAALAIVAVSVPAFAAPMNFETLSTVSKLAYDDFAAANPDHVVHFNGFKAWPSGDDGRVKIYVNHDGMAMEFNYNCHVHEEGAECHRQ